MPCYEFLLGPPTGQGAREKVQGEMERAADGSITHDTHRAKFPGMRRTRRADLWSWGLGRMRV